VALLGIDLGTTSAKAALYTASGELVAEAVEPCRVERPNEGWVEQDPEEIWRAARAVIRRVCAARKNDENDKERQDIRAVGICGHSPTLILVDWDGRPTRPAILWQDRRAAAEAAELAERRTPEEMAGLLGGRLPGGPSFPHPRLLWLRRHDPRPLDAAWRALDTKDWLNFRLTGEAASDPWSAKGLAHMGTGKPIGAWRELIGIDPGIAPTTRRPSELCGRVTAWASEQVGLPSGTPVAIGWTDGACAMLGTGCFAAPGAGFDTAGTSEVVGLTVPPGGRDDPRLLFAPGPDPAWRLVMGPTQAGGGSVAWAAGLLGVAPAEMAALAAGAAAGAGGVVFLPYLEGERAPLWDARARGVLFGLTSGHGRGEVARAVFEGVAHSIRHILDTIAEATGVAPTELRVCGGGAREPFWNQLKADLTGRPVRVTAQAETSALGAAMLGGVAAGVFASTDEAAAMVRLGRTYEPRDEPAYAKGHETYRALYPRLRDLFG
jgi:xylulokinase